jgi:hypothetical protein
MILAAAFAVAFALVGGRAVAQGNPVWQNPAVSQMPSHYPEYSAPIDPSMQPQPYVYRESRRTTICTRGTGKSSNTFFCN